MSFGCRRRCRLRVVAVLALLAAFPGAIVAASPAGAPAPRSTATARLTVVVPAPEVRRAIARHCRDEATVGYVPVVTVPAGSGGIPPDGRFVRCRSGAAVYLLPEGG